MFNNVWFDAIAWVIVICSTAIAVAEIVRYRKR